MLTLFGISMSKFLNRFVFVVGLFIAAVCSVGVASAANDKNFFGSVEGTWKGPGKIVAGKYKGTKFSCSLEGTPVKGKSIGVSMDGKCRVGVFNQPMNAVITKAGTSYRGKFLDGAKGKGLDIVSGRFNKSRAVVGINRNKLDGTMVADFLDKNTMNVTISVKVGKTMVPVIGMTLKRKSSRKTAMK